MKDREQCGNCAIYNYERQYCVRTQLHQDPSDHCSSWIAEVPTCQVCGQMFIPPRNYIVEDGKIFIVCGSCLSGLSTCRTCVNGKYCDFQQNPIQIPPVAQQTRQQGNMVVSQTVMNPARIAETCEKNCPCWDPIDKACNRQDCGTCGTGYKPSFLP
jgi:hypothetical protein